MIKSLLAQIEKKVSTANLVAALFFINPLYSNAQWSELGGTNSSTFNYYIQSLITDAAGNIDAGGFFTNNIGYTYIAKWTRTSWGILGGSSATFNSGVNRITKDNLGNIYATGGFTNGNGNRYVAKWNGSSWAEISGTNSSTFNDIITSVAVDTKGNVYAGGYFTNGISYLTGNPYVAKWNGTSWTELGGTKTSKLNNSIEYIITDTVGNVYAAGNFIDSVNKFYVAKWNGTNWIELGGTNLSPFNGYIRALTNDNKGNLYAVGAFKNAKGKEYVAKWNGTVWQELGGKDSSTFNDYIATIVSDAKGNIYIAGNFTNNNGKQYVAKWDGISWTELGGTNSSICNNIISSLTLDSIGNVYASGQFTNANGNYFVAKFTYPTTTPVTITNFTAKATEANQIKTTWQTALETNTDHFNLQRSTNGETFTTIGTIKASGNSSQTKQYGFIDQDAYHLQSKLMYYRLQSVDKDGSIVYSKIITVVLTNNILPLTIHPNPVNDHFNAQFTHTKAEQATLQVINMTGRVVKQITVSLHVGNNQLNVNVCELAKGSYIIIIQSKSYYWKQQIIKD